MNVVYQIIDWEDLFESAKSKTFKHCRKSYMPNKLDGCGFRRLMAIPNGYKVYCAFILMIHVCSQQEKPRTGILAKNGNPYDSIDLAAKTGAPAKIFEEAFEILRDEKIKWIRKIDLEIAKKFSRAGAPVREDRNEGEIIEKDTKLNFTDTKIRFSVLKSLHNDLIRLDLIRIEDKSTNVSLSFAPDDKNIVPRHKRILFNYSSEKLTGIENSDIEEWTKAFPAVDIKQEILIAEQWLINNPTKRKKNVSRFLTNWLSRTQERGGNNNNANTRKNNVGKSFSGTLQ